MARYIVCDKCKELVEYKPETKYEEGTFYTIFKCPKCDHVKTTTINYVHYGLDGKR